MTPPVVLTIAGSDSGAGAGIQADLKTFAALGCYGTSVITAVTAQNTVRVSDVFALPTNVIGLQLGSVLGDFPVKAVKVGMVASEAIATTIAARARAGELPNLVVDPVLAAATGRRLGTVNAVERLLPYATVITPNRAEASALLGWKVSTPDDMVNAASQLAGQGAECVVVTGGEAGESAGGDAVDVVWTAAGVCMYTGPRVVTRNEHGTGCTYSAAIAGRLAWGDAVEDAIGFAKRYVHSALVAARDWRLGMGAGPVNHFVKGE